ncbi:hypothetical protein KR044_001786 [Drosophila immigrans]|nr:hypothetical protein KR044_001786 [Drosophila immigrans]
MAFTVLSTLLMVLLVIAVEAHRTFDRCGLARELDNLDVPRRDIATWVCIAQHESSFRTWVIGPPNNDGSQDHGLFQINDLYWCQPDNGKFSHNECNEMCDALRTDHIERALRCAQKIKRSQGWTAWSVYNPHCAGRLPSIDDCFGSRSNSLYGANTYGKY